MHFLHLLLLVYVQLMQNGYGYPEHKLGSQVKEVVLWTAGQGGYHTYRIPALVVTPRGHVLAFCEGRKNGPTDAGDIDLLVRKSTDYGRTWTASTLLWNDQNNTCGNPAPIADHITGVVWLLATWNLGSDREPDIIAGKGEDTRRIYILSSADDGQTWSPPREITASVKNPDWTWYATGPGSGIQMQQGPHQGRLILGCDHIERLTHHYYSHIIFSDDHGATWQLGGSSPQHQVNECEVAELSGGRLLLNMRNYNSERKNRQIAFSNDGGLTWAGQRFDTSLVDPICQASLFSYQDLKKQEELKVLFSNPSSLRRENMTLQISKDESASWSKKITLYPGPSAYSDLAVLPNKKVACLYERGRDNPYEEIVLTSIKLKDTNN